MSVEVESFSLFQPPSHQTHLILNQNEHISDAIIWHHDWIKTNPFLEVLCRDCDFFKICTCSGYVNTKKIIKMEKITCFPAFSISSWYFYFLVFLVREIRESSSLSFNFSVIQVLKSSRVAYYNWVTLLVSLSDWQNLDIYTHWPGQKLLRCLVEVSIEIFASRLPFTPLTNP